ncbi:MAG: HDIG domain-containing protein [Clostridia bacterium]|nr:HDIG domain-containing protein [Clostridia bacterium]
MDKGGSKTSHRKVIFSIILIFIMLAVTAFVCAFTLTPKRFSVSVGDEMPETVRADVTIRDSTTGEIIYDKGDVVISEGATITHYDMTILESLDLIKEKASDVALYIGISLILIGACAVFVAFAMQSDKAVLINPRYMTIVALSVIITMIISLGLKRLSVFIIPATLSVLLISLLINRRTAYGLLIFSSIAVGLLAGEKGVVFNGTSTVMMVATLISGSIAIPLMRNKHNRGSLLVGGSIAAIVNGLCIVVCMLISMQSLEVILISGAYGLAGGILSTVLCVGTMPVWENIFDITTPSRLYELTNANHPLLKQLMTEAPGTYHHSVMVALLAESAAQVIGANSALARVGGYYHDVGKLRRPLYFRENQSQENIHDTLSPSESASIIIAHQADSVAILKKAKLPGDVIKIASEHHGNALMTYFYSKAKADDPSVTQRGFRYTGNRPSSAESAIVMLADCCEAAVRSLKTTDKSEIEAMVHKVISSKYQDKDSMLMNSPLTLQQISAIERAFLKTFNGILHDRVKYPEMDKQS